MNANLEFDNWYRQETPGLLASLALSIGDKDAAKDSLDEACMRAFERWKRVSRMESPSGWVFKVALNHARKQFRRQKRDRDLTHDQPWSEQPQVPNPEIWRALQELPEQQRAVFVCRSLLDWSEQRTGKVLGKRRGTVAATYRKARKNLQGALTSAPELKGLNHANL